MQKQTREAFNAYKAQIAQLNGVSDVTEKFTVDPSVEQTLEKKIQERSTFLSAVNVVGVQQQTGEKLRMGASATIAGTTDTDAADRATQDPTGLDKDSYACYQTNFDTHVKYSKLDAWAKFPNFQAMMRDIVLDQIGRDRMMIGFNGTSRAATSNRTNNPLLQDVNVGWLQEARAKNPARCIDEVVASSGQVRIGVLADGTKGDYANLDALVFDMVHSLIEPWYRGDTLLRVIMGRELMVDKFFPLIEAHGATPTEANALDLMLSAKRIGGLQAAQVPFFPERGLVITRLDNLSIYYQEGTRRRTLVDNAKRDRIEDYQSVNEDYVIEDHGLFALCENVVFPNAAVTGWA